MEDAVVEISDKHVIHFKTKGNIFKVPKAFNDLSFMISSVRFFSKNIYRHGCVTLFFPMAALCLEKGFIK